MHIYMIDNFSKYTNTYFSSFLFMQSAGCQGSSHSSLQRLWKVMSLNWISLAASTHSFPDNPTNTYFFQIHPLHWVSGDRLFIEGKIWFLRPEKVWVAKAGRTEWHWGIPSHSSRAGSPSEPSQEILLLLNPTSWWPELSTVGKAILALDKTILFIHFALQFNLNKLDSMCIKQERGGGFCEARDSTHFPCVNDTQLEMWPF